MEKSLSRIYFLEVEIICKAFANKFGKDETEVLTFGINELIKSNTIKIENILLDKSDLNKMKVVELKDELKWRNLKSSGNKSELQLRLSQHIEQLHMLINT